MAAMMKSPLDCDAAELIARRFHALSDPTRLRILDVLRRRDEASVGELAKELGATQQNVSKHLAALRDEGFLARRKEGTSSIYRIADSTVLELCDRLCTAMEAQLAELGGVLSD
jgi:DNA-binding transcriptional ArsR family regulator